MKLKKLMVIALILFALISLPISFASDSDVNSLKEVIGSYESIDQNTDIGLENYINQNDLNLEDSNLDNFNLDNSDLDNSDLDDSNIGISDSIDDIEENLKNKATVSSSDNDSEPILTDSNVIDYNSPNLDTNFTILNVTFTDSNTIFVNASYTGSVESGTIENPYKTLNAAFTQFAKSTNNKTNIFLAEGLYQITGRMTISKNVNIVGESALNTIISGGDRYQIFFISPPSTYGAVSPFVNLFNLTFTHATSYYGGAIYVNESGLNIVNVIFRGNKAENMSNYYSSSTYPGSGGAIYIDKAFVKIYNATFADNRALGKEDAYAGALFNDMGETTIINSRFINNTVKAINGAAGAIYDYNGILVLFNSTIANNTINSTFSMGGAIATWSTHNLYVLNSSIDGNSIYGNYTFGSAIINKAFNFILANTTISNNLANGTSDINGTFLNLNGFINSSNVQFENNIAKNPLNNLFLCLEDQAIIERPFSQDLLVDLPSRYDLRDYGLVTPIKDQGGSESCWAFTTLAALESYLLKYENISYDFSENNMKNLMGYYGLNGTDWPDGGNHYMALAYLLRWSGPVNETQDPFDDAGHSSKSNLNLTKHVQDVLYIPVRLNYLDLDQIKYALMTYGALYTTIHADNGFQYNSDYYKDIISVSNHAVTIVGWDDNYSADNFAVRPPGDGAFIIKNSWGTDYGYEGYWYVSYYDKTVASYGMEVLSAMAITNVENVSNYKTNYQYDILGNTFESIGFGCSTAWFANQFTAKNNNPLSAFGLYTYGDSSYLVNITVNGVVKYIQEGLIKGAGYHTVKLNDFVELSKGDIFRIAVKLTTASTIFPIAIESQRPDYSSGADADEGQSFISADGIEWNDLADFNKVIKFYQFADNYTLEKANVCLKAYATGYADVFLNVKSNASVYYKGDSIEISLTISNEGDPIRDINISTILDSGVSIKSIVAYKGSFDYSSKVWHLDSLSQDETVTLKLKLSISKIKDVISTAFNFNYAGFIPSNISTQASIDVFYGGLTSIPQLENTVTIAKSQDELLIKLLDWNSSPLANKPIVISLLDSEIGGDLDNINFNPVSLITDDEGNAKFVLDLLAGNYKFLASFEGDKNLDSSNMTFNVSVNKIGTVIKVIGDYNLSNISTFARSNDELKFYLIDGNGDVIKDKIIHLSNSQTGQIIDLRSDENGVFKYNLNLSKGTYNFDLDFLNDDVYDNSHLSFIVDVLKRDAPVISIEKTLLEVHDGLVINLKDQSGISLTKKVLKLLITDNRGSQYSLDALTDEEGLLKLYNFYAGNYDIRIVFEDDDEYDDAILESSFSVVQKKTQIIYSDMITTAVDFKNDGSVGNYFNWTLKDENGNPIVNKPMQIGFNGVIYNVVTNDEGIARLQINLAYKGDYTFAICFLGDSDYSASFNVAKITVNTQTPSLTVPNKSYKATAKTKSLTATFKSNKGTLIANKKVTFTVNGKTYTAKTNAKGVATVNVALTKKGSYNFTAKFAGDSTYSAISKTATLKLT